MINTIICGDSSDIMKQVPDASVDLILTSPPYNFGMSYDTVNDKKEWNKYFSDLFVIFNECIRCLKSGGRIVVNIQPLFSDNIPSHHIISTYFLSKGMLWKGGILWEKNNYNCNYSAWGSWKSPSSPYLKYTHEFIEIYCKDSLKKSGDKDNIDITADEFKTWVLAKWSIGTVKASKYNHPATMPEQLAERVIKLFSFKNDVILDPFNGVGTVTAVANRLDRKYIGIDISKEYCATAEQRIKEYNSQLKLI